MFIENKLRYFLSNESHPQVSSEHIPQCQYSESIEPLFTKSGRLPYQRKQKGYVKKRTVR